MGFGGFFINAAQGAKTILRDKQLTMLLLVAAIGACIILSVVLIIAAMYF